MIGRPSVNVGQVMARQRAVMLVGMVRHGVCDGRRIMLRKRCNSSRAVNVKGCMDVP